MHVVLGINGYPLQGHDASAALVIDGSLIAAVEEERLCRVKRAMGRSPESAIYEVLRIASLLPSEVDVVAIPWRPDAMGYSESLLTQQLRSWLSSLGFRGSEIKIMFVEHHEAHAWSGLVYAQDFHKKKYGVLVVDGSGESTGGAAFRYDGDMRTLWHITQQSSLGLYYEGVTQYLGFRWGQEGKTMGLAAYGRQASVLLPCIPDERIVGVLPPWDKSKGSPKSCHENYRERLIREMSLLQQVSTFNQKADFALAAQDYVCKRIMQYVKELAEDVDGIILAGGVALNCANNVVVGKYCQSHNIELVIPPPASDTGVAIGAAIAAANHLGEKIKSITSPYWGFNYTESLILDEFSKIGICPETISIDDMTSLLFDKNYIMGWFEGRCEIGPRALGHRCIVARPDSTYLRDKINVLKGRESWRPLAPSVSEKEFKSAFKEGEIPSPYMLINASLRDDSFTMAGVTHVDGTARPQVVMENDAYSSLLKSVGNYNGHEAIICTSFNRAGEPIVYSPEDAIKSAKAMHLDALAGDGWIVKINKL